MQSQTNTVMLDRVVANRHPILGMPHTATAFEPLQRPGNRYLLGAQGLYAEVRRAWLYARFLIAPVDTPYGAVQPMLRSRYRPSPQELEQFTEQAKAAGQLETAAWVIWDQNTEKTRYVALQARQADSVSLVVDRPALAQGEHLVLDLHSHHVMDPAFSRTDDEDDLQSREIKFAAVLGRIDQTQPEWAFRLCVEGHAFYGQQEPFIEYGDLP